MFEARQFYKCVVTSRRQLVRATGVVLCASLVVLAAPLPGPDRSNASAQVLTPKVHRVMRELPRARAVAIPQVTELSSFTAHPTATDKYVAALINRDFPPAARQDAEAVAWCESKFQPRDIGFDSNGTHDRGLFQLNDGGTQQYIMKMLGFNPNNLSLALNPVLNVRAAALLWHRDGWSPWSCSYVLA